MNDALSSAVAPPNLVPIPMPDTILANLGLNVEDAEIARNIDHNIRLGLPQLQPYDRQDTRIALVCGGPSLTDNADALQELYWQGYRVAAVNGSYEWCLARGIRPAFMFMVDARPFNARFLTRPAPHCQYWLASQCAPETVDRAASWPGSDVRLWHVVANDAERERLERHYNGLITVGGFGSTIGLRALSILMVLGLRWFEVFGMDSCKSTAAHHAYPQPENDDDDTMHLQVGDSWFLASGWQASQASECVKFLTEYQQAAVNINFWGHGLIAHLAEAAGVARRRSA